MYNNSLCYFGDHYMFNSQRRRLKFANGDDVPRVLDVRQEGRRWFFLQENGEEIEVFTAATLSSRRLKFANGDDVPRVLDVRQEGRRPFFLQENGEEVEAFTASGLSIRRLKFENGDDEVSIPDFCSKLKEQIESNAPSLDSYLRSLSLSYLSKALQWAAQNDHLDVINHLFQWATANNHPQVIKSALSIPAVFSLIDKYLDTYNKYIIPFVAEKLLDLKEAQLSFEEKNPNGVFDIEDANESILSFNIIRNLIRRNDSSLFDDLQRLINIPSVNFLLHRAAKFQRDNELLCLALNIRNLDAARLLIAIPAVQVLAEENNYYKTRPTEDSESSIKALSTAEKNFLQRATDHYDVQLKELTVPVIMDNLRSTLCARYKEKPAQIVSDAGVTIDLPMHWIDFKALELCKSGVEGQSTEHQRALEAYYQHKDHTAFRYLLKPNPWIHSNASYVNSNGAERWANFDGYEPLIAMLFLAASDEHIKPCDGCAIGARLEQFINELVFIGRAHNWDVQRVKVDAEGKPLLNEFGELLMEEYDDLEGDRPSCFSGVKKRLLQSMSGHPLLTFLTPDIVEQKLNELVREHFKAAINLGNRGKFKKAWDDIQDDDLEYEERLTAVEILKELNINPKQQSALIQTMAQFLNETYDGQFNEDISLTVVALKRLRLDERDKFATHASELSYTNWDACLKVKVIHNAATASLLSTMSIFASTTPEPMEEEPAMEEEDGTPMMKKSC